jgi:general secretion pathway protein D
VVPRDKTVSIIKNSKDLVREAMPVYIGTALIELPRNDQMIRYVFSLSNIKISERERGGDNEFATLFKTIMPADSLFQMDPATNSVILIARASHIQQYMKILLELDQIDFREHIEIVKLRYASTDIIAALINESIFKGFGVADKAHLDKKRESDIPFFSPSTKVIPVARTNTLILLGESQAIDRLKDFIYTHLDVDLSKQSPDAESVLHVYKLQYLDADTLAPILQRIVDASRGEGTGQSRGEKGSGKAEREYGEVIIIPDKPKRADELKYYGGNKLIIACRNADWKEINKLIEQLDRPEKQVYIEILVADLSLDDARRIAADLRSSSKIPMPNLMEFQSAQLDPQVVVGFDKANKPETIAGDLLAALDPTASPPTTLASSFPIGSSILTLSNSDQSVWGVVQLLQLFTHSKILSHPHVIATNNKPSLIVSGEIRLLTDETTGSSGGTPVTRFKEISAELRIEMTARIMADDVALQVLIKVNDFIPTADAQNAQTIRQVETNVIIENGAVAAFGGLTKTTNTISKNETPILSRIPLIGRLWQNEQAEVRKDDLVVFICPTIIDPAKERGMADYTADYIELVKSESSDLFQDLKDPISRWFFAIESETENEIAAFMSYGADARQEKIIAAEEKPDIVRLENPVEKTAQITEEIARTDEAVLAELRSKLKQSTNPFAKIPPTVFTSTEPFQQG